jgi:hypothetical protein
MSAACAGGSQNSTSSRNGSLISLRQSFSRHGQAADEIATDLAIRKPVAILLQSGQLPA